MAHRRKAQTASAEDGRAIGARIRALRLARGLSQGELAKLTGLSEPTLSRIENGQSLISAHKLYTLAEVLGTDISAFFGPAATTVAPGVRSITRKGEGAAFTSPRYVARVLATDLARKSMHPAINTVTARDPVPLEELSRHDGEEFLYVLSGTLVLQSEHYAPLRLEAGDSVYFDARMGHAYLSGSRQPAVFLVVATTAPPLA